MQASRVLIFGDGPADREATFQRVHQLAKSHFQLKRFLTEATKLVRDEAIIGVGLTGAEKTKIGEIADLVELAPGYQSRTVDATANAVLSICAQISELLIVAQSRPEVLREDSEAVAFSFGQLAAAVATTSHDLDEVVKTGLVAVVAGLRLALELQRRAWDVEESEEPWACTLQGLTAASAQQLLESFNNGRQGSHQAYVAISTNQWTTICAPPTDLARFCELSEVKDLTKSFPTYPASVHASHMPTLDFSCVLEPASTLTLSVQQRLETVVSAIASENQSFDTLLEPFLDSEDDLEVITFDTSKVGAAAADALETAPSHSSRATDIKPLSSIEKNPSGMLAIVGMAGRFPESDTLDEFWDVLAAGTDCHKPIPTSRFDAEHYYSPAGEGQKGMPSKWGCFMRTPGNFDHRFFNISPKEAGQMDPQQRILLMATWEALEMAGYNGRGNGRVAAYFGQTTDDYKHIQDQQGVETHYLPALNRGFAPGRLSHFFKWDAGFYSIDTGCSSSATCVALAREALAAGECDAAVVGGGALHTAPEWYSGLGKGGFLSKTGACKTYQATADGYCRGEAVAVLVVKRLEDAMKANDNVLAVIAGAARNGNAGAGSITHPGEDAQVALYQKAMRQAGITGDDVTMIEMHGTGTQAGDKTEMAAVRRAVVNSRTTETPIPVGAVKAFVGHSEAAAGAVSLIKAVMMLDRGIAPRQPHYPFALNPKIGDVQNGRIRIANNQALVRPAHGGRRSILINCFDAAGGNCSMVVQDAPAVSELQEDPRTHHVIITTGKTQSAHDNNRRRLRQYLTLNPHTRLSDLAYTTTARRMIQDMPYVGVYSVSSIDELNRNLDRPGSTQPLTKNADSHQQVFAFTGQGSQYNGMGSVLYKTSGAFRRILDSLERLCTFQDSKQSFLDIIKGTQDVDTAAPAQLQLAIVALEIALARYWQRLGMKPSLTIGHSLGEYAGLCIAGVLSARDALFLVHSRATLMTERCEAGAFGMLAVQLPASTLQEMIDSYFPGTCEISCLNGPSMTVVSGSHGALKMVEESLKGMEVKSTPLPVQFAFHSKQLDPIAADYELLADRSVNFRAPKLPVASTLLGRIVQPGEEGVFSGNYLRRQMRQPVDFVGAVQDCEATGAITNSSLILEVGPTPVCVALIPRCLRSVKPQTLSSLQKGCQDWETVSRCLTAVTLKGASVNWPEFHQDFLKSVRPIHDLPAYAFDLTEFWASYQTQPEAVPVANAVAPRPNGKDLGLTALQKLESRESNGRHTTATFLSEVGEEGLHKMIWGHNVDGTAICPASVFIDMAYSAALFVLNSAGVSADPSSLEMEDLIMKSPLVADEDREACPTVRVQASYDSESKTVSVQFSSFMAPQAPAKEHGSCRLVVLPPNAAGWVGHWQRMQHLIQTRVHTLDAANPRELHMINKDLMYKLFSELVDYSKPYQLVDEITMPLDFHDAAAQLSIKSPEEHGSFTCNPFAMDSIVHLVGFLLNGDIARPKEKIHIASYIGRTHVLEDLSKTRSARCYAAVRQSDRNGTTVCDAYVFDEAASPAKLVAVCTDIRFNCLDQDFFATICGRPKSRSSSRASSRHSTRSRRSSRRSSRRRVIESESELDSEDESDYESPAPARSSRSGRSTPATSAAEPDMAEMLLGAVSKRSGISIADMDQTSSFTAMGIDSQMSISIISDFTKLTGEELPASFFTTFPTVADVQEELGSKDDKSNGLGTQRAQSPAPKASSRAPSRASRSTTRSRASSRAKTPNPKSKKSKAPMSPSSQLLKVLANQLGMEVEELKSVPSFGSLGVDSMMSIKVLGTFQEQTGVELPASFFNDFNSVAAIVEELDDGAEAEAVASDSEPEPETPRAVVKAAPAPQPEVAEPGEIVSRAILIQGKSRNTDPPLFLTTDGSGTVESYINFPALPGGRRIYGLESPFADCPEQYNVSIGDMCEAFIKALQKIQPQGPYLLGGWSAGSVYAYEIARRLTERGHEILGLLILDMRIPSLIPRPTVTMPFIERLGASEGLKGAKNFDSNLTPRERAHLWATCRALARYYAVAIPQNQKPKNVHVVWATKGLNESDDVTAHDNRVNIPAEMGILTKDVMHAGMTEKELEEKFELIFKSWFYGKRLHLNSTNGWEKLLGDDITIHQVEADHFSIVQQPAVRDLGDIVLDAINKATA